MYHHYKLPKAKNHKIGILFIIKAETESQFIDANSKLIDKFGTIIKSSQKNDFDIIQIRHLNLSRYDLHSKEAAIKLLKKVNCIFSVSINILADDVDEPSNYVVTINTGIIHPTYKDEAQRFFEQSIVHVAGLFSRISFQNENKIEEYEVTAHNLVYACKYIIGLSYLLSNNLDASSELFNELFIDLSRNKRNQPIINSLKSTIPKYCFHIYLHKATVIYSQYRKEKDPELLILLNQILDELNRFVPDTHFYYQLKSIYSFFIKDYSAAKEYINKCELLNADSTWKYNKAFFYAFESAAFFKIYKLYKAALKTPYNLDDLVSFILDVLLEDPDRIGLHFALGMIHSHQKDLEKATSHFNLFSELYNGSDADKLHSLIIERLNFSSLIL